MKNFRLVSLFTVFSSMFIAVILLTGSKASAATITVNSSSDATGNNGACTLREAIINANNNSQLGSTDCIAGSGASDTIVFSSAMTITIGSVLNTITTPVIIDATANSGPSTCGDIVPSLPGSNTAHTIGVEINGTGASGSPSGLLFSGSTANGSAVRGMSITGFAQNGIFVSQTTTSMTIECNYIGVTRTGVASGNTLAGILMNGADGNLIRENVISNNVGINGGIGLALNVTGANSNTIEENIIGLAPNGSTAMGNTNAGISISASSSNTIQNNVIGSNGTAGISLASSSSGNTIDSNYIGLAVDGTTARGNTTNGIGVTNTTTTTISNNTISSNGTSGIAITGTSSGNDILSNIIGLDYSATLTRGNTQYGMLINGGASDTDVGAVGQGNTISANNVGIGVDGATTADVVIVANYIGTNSLLATGLGNGTGVAFTTSTLDHQVGGTAAGAANTIAHNTLTGVGLASTALGISVLGNSMFSNGFLGMDLDNNGDVEENDPLDADAGANNLLNFPVFTSAAVFGGQTTINYTLDLPAGDYRVEFFSNTDADTSGNGEGETFLGADSITHAGAGVQAFSNAIASDLDGVIVTATVTEDLGAGDYGDTSEFNDFMVAGDDFDGDELQDALDGDDDGDGIADITESCSDDFDGDGNVDCRDLDSDGDGIPDSIEGTSDFDGDGASNYRDLDSDGDEVLDIVEAFDANGNGVPDVSPTGTDSDGDGLDDVFDTVTLSTDPDNNPSGYSYVETDSNGNGVVDFLDTATLVSLIDEIISDLLANTGQSTTTLVQLIVILLVSSTAISSAYRKRQNAFYSIR